jgi:hypothetical protein
MVRSVLVSVWLLAFPVIAAADTRVDFDPTKDFSRYKTFAVEVGTLIDSDGAVDEGNTLAEYRLREAVVHQFQLRGLEESENADLIVRVSRRESERTVVTGSRYPYWGGYWGGYWGPYGHWGPGYYDDVSTFQYIEEKVTFDIRERGTDELVYRAQVTDEAEGDIEDLAKQARKIARKAFKKYPVRMLVDSD